MPFTKIFIDDERTGEPRQPIPLRLAHRIAGWSVKQMAQLLSERLEGGYEILTAYEYKPSITPAKAPQSDFVDFLKDSSTLTDLEIIKIIPPNYFIWSTDLAKAFSDAIDMHVGRQEASEQGMSLDWNPAYGEEKKLIQACSNFYEILPLRIRQQIKALESKRTKREIYWDWFQRDIELEDTSDDLSSQLQRAKQIISEDNLSVSPAHVVRMIRDVKDNQEKFMPKQ